MQVKNGSPGDVLDSIWLELLLAMTGEQFGDDSDLICGLVCSVREKGSKIEMWTKEWKAEEGNMRIGYKFFHSIFDTVLHCLNEQCCAGC
ncbi:unnamed protein product [Strongylus vulgaris]|uniref:Uncharacterized protein n=1 Tax=Strongylus vulgaris TaxID=40348 RepID=A0A3P7LFX0_STRVU|nr:unnamed protein product [Strongylus vulgaris]